MRTDEELLKISQKYKSSDIPKTNNSSELRGDALLSSLNTDDSNLPMTPEKQTDWIDKLGEFGSAGGRSILRTGATALSGMEKLLQAPLKLTGQKFPEKTSAQSLIPSELTREAKTPTEKAGGIFGEAVQYLSPTGLEKAGVSLTAKILPKLAVKSGGLLAKLISGTAKTIAGGTELAGKTALMGGTPEEVKQSGLIGASAVPVMGTIGGVIKGATKLLPEKLMNSMFKIAKDDLEQYYRTVAKGGQKDPTLSQELLKRNVFGSSENMAVYSLNKLDTLEKAVQETVKNSKELIKLPNKNAFVNLLGTIEKTFKKGFFSGRANEAKALKEAIISNKGELPMELALTTRRFLDKMRNTSSFRLDTNLAPKQEEFKLAANQLRKNLSDKGLKDLMNEERIFIEAFDAILDDAVRRGNKNVLSLTDAILGGGGLATGLTGPAIGAMAAYRAFQSPISLTGTAQGLYRAGRVAEKISPFAKQLPRIIPPLINK